jgi:hypothetical protein
MDKIVTAIHEQLALSYASAGRVVPTNAAIIAATLQDALQFNDVEEVHNAFRRARDMADIPTQRVLKEALMNHRRENLPQPKVEMIEDNRPGKKMATNEERAYIFATHSVCGTGPKIKNDREIIAQFEANPKNAEFVEYQRTCLKNYIRTHRENKRSIRND